MSTENELFPPKKSSPAVFIPYRTDIDGLRAVSVIAVILFHTGLACPGGYVGVDVFFVISGYLITSLILKEFEQDGFSFTRFWLRRIRRILPAVFVMTLSTLALGYWLLMPYHLVQAAKSALAQLFFASNFFFWRDRNYFNQESEWKPFLHTWSLSVEEQFYIILPFVMYVVYRWRKHSLPAVTCSDKQQSCPNLEGETPAAPTSNLDATSNSYRNLRKVNFFLPLALATVVSFGLSCNLVTDSPAATFYLLPTRAWELLAGALIIWLPFSQFADNRKAKIFSEAAAVIGVVCLAVSFFAYDRSTVFPGVAALLPVLGTVFILLGNTQSQTILGKFLSLPPLVFLGKISFPLYLWHWPLLAVARYAVDGSLTFSATVFLIIVTTLISTLSYFVIEQPIRKRQILSSPAALMLGVAIAWLSIAAVSTSIYFQKGFPNRSRLVQGLETELFPVSEIQAIRDNKLPLLGDRDNPNLSFIIWGDSHSAVNMPMIDVVARKRGICGLGAAMPSSPPLPGTMNGWNHDLLEWNTGVLELIEQTDIRHVFLFARWSSYIEKVADYDLLFGADPLQTLIYMDPKSPKNPETAIQVFKESIRKLCERLTSQGRHVYLFPQVPEQLTNPRIKAFIEERTLGWISNTQQGIDRLSHNKRQNRVDEVFRSLESSLVTRVSSDKFLFDKNDQAVLWNDEQLVYSDPHHLTIEGTYFAIAPLLEPIFDTIAGSSRARSLSAP